MKSYAAIDRIEGNYAVCEVELSDFITSNSEDFYSKETVMINILLQDIVNCVGEVAESDILIVEHDKKEIFKVILKDDNEKFRRIKLIENILKK